MGYTKKWIPTTVPLRDDLEAWKILFEDLHQNLLSAGLTQTETEGQLVIPDVEALPADGGFAGFIEYALDDGLQSTAPVIITIEYGCNSEGAFIGTSQSGRSSVRSRTPSVNVTVSFGGGQTKFSCPQNTYRGNGGTNTSQLVNTGISYASYNKERGFLGFIYGAGSRNKPFAHHGGSYYGSTLTLLVQRTVDEQGIPTSDGVMVYRGSVGDKDGETNNLWVSGIISPATSVFLRGDGAVFEGDMYATRIGGNDYSIIEGEIQTQLLFCPSPRPIAFPWIVSYAVPSTGADIPEGNEFDIEIFPGATNNFIALGNETGISIDTVVGQRAGLAILFE